MLDDIEAQEAEREDQPGVLEIFLSRGEQPAEDAPMTRDDAA